MLLRVTKGGNRNLKPPHSCEQFNPRQWPASLRSAIPEQSHMPLEVPKWLFSFSNIRFWSARRRLLDLRGPAAQVTEVRDAKPQLRPLARLILFHRLRLMASVRSMLYPVFVSLSPNGALETHLEGDTAPHAGKRYNLPADATRWKMGHIPYHVQGCGRQLPLGSSALICPHAAKTIAAYGSNKQHTSYR